MRQTKGLASWLESKGAALAYGAAIVSVILRAAQAYSGGAINLRAMLGPVGFTVLDALTGIGIAIGAEMLASVAGRQWRMYGRERMDARGRRGISKGERQALVAHYASEARRSLFFMGLGIVASLYGTLAFFAGAAGGELETLGQRVGALAIASLMVSIITYFGVFHEPRQADPRAEATERARAATMDVVTAAGERIKRGEGSISDVRLLARQLPKQEGERFLAALAPDTPDDPYWQVADIAAWLGTDTPAVRRQLTRRLAKLEDEGAAIIRNERGAYLILRSAAVLYWMDDFLRIQRGERVTPTAAVPTATSVRQSGAPTPLVLPETADKDRRETGVGPLSANGAGLAPAYVADESTHSVTQSGVTLV